MRLPVFLPFFIFMIFRIASTTKIRHRREKVEALRVEAPQPDFLRLEKRDARLEYYRIARAFDAPSAGRDWQSKESVRRALDQWAHRRQCTSSFELFMNASEKYENIMRVQRTTAFASVSLIQEKVNLFIMKSNGSLTKSQILEFTESAISSNCSVEWDTCRRLLSGGAVWSDNTNPFMPPAIAEMEKADLGSTQPPKPLFLHRVDAASRAAFFRLARSLSGVPAHTARTQIDQWANQHNVTNELDEYYSARAVRGFRAGSKQTNTLTEWMNAEMSEIEKEDREAEERRMKAAVKATLDEEDRQEALRATEAARLEADRVAALRLNDTDTDLLEVLMEETAPPPIEYPWLDWTNVAEHSGEIVGVSIFTLLIFSCGLCCCTCCCRPCRRAAKRRRSQSRSRQ